MQYYRPVIEDLVRLEMWDPAWALIDSIEPHVPKTLEGLDLLQFLNHKTKRYLKAIQFGELALGSTNDPQIKTSVRFNLSKSYVSANYPEKAIQALTTNSQVANQDPDQQIDLAVALYAANRKDESEQLLIHYKNTFVNDEKNQDIAEFNLGNHYIRHGQFIKGMQALNVGRKLKVFGHHTHNFPIPEWDGIARPGKTILVVGEGGIGDEIINVRFCKHLRQRGMIPSWASAHGLASLFSRLPFASTQNYTQFTTDIKNIKTFDYWTPAMSLPYVLGVDSTDLWYGQYLSVDPAFKSKWKSVFDTPNIKVGLKWAGNPLYEQDLHRTIPLDSVYAAIKQTLPAAQVFSLQKENAEQCHKFSDITDLSDRLESFEDTLAVIDSLDVVVTSCTSIAHAAAALNKPTLVFVPIMCYYLWAEEQPKSAWYGDNLTLLRQEKPRDWSAPINMLQDRLVEYTNHG